MWLVHLTLSILFQLNDCERTLIWSDEFNQDLLDTSNWLIKANPDLCEKQFNPKSQSCNKFNGNIEVSNGTLKMFVREEYYQGHNFTGATIRGTKCFSNVRIEIKAKKPNGYELNAGLVMYSWKGQCPVGQYNGQIDIAKLRDNNIIWSSIHYGQWKSHDEITYADPFNINLNEFQVYGVEWNETDINWFVNNHTIYHANKMMDQHGRTFNTSEPYYLPFDHPFNLMLHIGVSSFIPHGEEPGVLNNSLLKSWISPKFEIDYIRVYRITTDSANTSVPILYTVIFPITLLIIILLVISLIIFIFMWKRQKRKNVEIVKDNFYDDISLKDENYEQYNSPNAYEIPNYDKVEYQTTNFNEYVEVFEDHDI